MLASIKNTNINTQQINSTESINLPDVVNNGLKKH
jgi:hypothetical protein